MKLANGRRLVRDSKTVTVTEIDTTIKPASISHPQSRERRKSPASFEEF